MRSSSPSPGRLRSLSSVALLPVAATFAFTSAVAQQKAPVAPADYGRWENLGAATLSPDGAWIAYGVSRVDEESELRYRRLSGDATVSVEWGHNPRFSPDSRWLVWAVGVSPDERERSTEADEPVREGAGLLNLASGDERSFEGVQSSAFDASGRYLALHGYAPDEPEGKGADIRILDLETGTETSFGNVSEFAWSDQRSLIAMAIATGEDAGNGLQVYDASDGRIRSLDASGSAYRQLAWREGAADVAVLRSVEDASEDDPAHALLVWIGVEGPAPVARSLHPSGDGDLDIVQHRRPAWSDGGRLISIGFRPSEPDEG